MMFAVPRFPSSVKVLPPPAVIVTSSADDPTLITTVAPHGFVTGDVLRIAGHSTAGKNGDFPIDVRSTRTFTVDATGAAGTGGTATRLIAKSLLTLAQAKLLAGLDWDTDPERDAMMAKFIAAAEQQVEQDTGLALLAQIREVYFDYLPTVRPLLLPTQCTPLQDVVSLSWIDTAGAANPVPVIAYEVVPGTGQIGLAPGGSWPTGAMRQYSPWVLRLVAGWNATLEIPGSLVQAHGLLTAHYATAGRDAVALGTIVADMPFGYAELVHAHRLVSIA